MHRNPAVKFPAVMKLAFVAMFYLFFLTSFLQLMDWTWTKGIPVRSVLVPINQFHVSFRRLSIAPSTNLS